MSQTLSNARVVLTPDEIRNTCRDQKAVHFRCPEGALEELLTWDQLNETLSRVSVTRDMMSVMHRRRGVPDTMFLEGAGDGRRRVKTAALEEHMKAGATLIVRDVQTLVPAINTLCKTWSEALLLPVRAVLFLSFGRDTSFGLHWHHFDTFICQVYGRKHWKVFEPVVQKPLSEGHPPEPFTAPPVWESMLCAGEILYVPRGWPHDPISITEPSLHVALNLFQPTGLDLMRLVVADLASSVAARTELPMLQTSQDRTAYLNSLRECLMERLSESAFRNYCLRYRSGAYTRDLRLPV
jgi:ribosomal protein L16 Arg81 hydroxylase